MNPISAPSKSLEKILAHIRKGGEAFIQTAVRVTIINKKTLAKWYVAGMWLLREDGDGYRLRCGKSSVYLLPGQLQLR